MIHIVIEGLDGSGKSTLAAALQERLLSDPGFCHWIYLTKEPGLETRTAPAIKFNRPGIDVRSIVLNDKSLTSFERELMFYVDASQHRRFIQNQNEAIVISDRGLWSHLAYAYATMKTKQMDYEQYQVCKQVMKHACTIPNITIYLEADLELMRERSKSRGEGKDVIESNGDSFFEHVLSQYQQLSQSPLPEGKLLKLNAKNSTSQNVDFIVSYLKEELSDEGIKSGNFELRNKQGILQT